MGFMDKIKDLVTSSEDYYDDEFDNNEEEVVYNTEEKKSKKESAQATPFPEEKRNKYVNISATTQLQVVLVKPERYEDAPSIADHLNNKRTVVLNLESANKETTRRLVDFLSGVAYANNGQIKRVAASTFIITPFNVDLVGDLVLDELESSNLYL